MKSGEAPVTPRRALSRVAAQRSRATEPLARAALMDQIQSKPSQSPFIPVNHGIFFAKEPLCFFVISLPSSIVQKYLRNCHFFYVLVPKIFQSITRHPYPIYFQSNPFIQGLFTFQPLVSSNLAPRSSNLSQIIPRNLVLSIHFSF